MIDRRLHVLRMVASRGTVTGAAEALHYTPSAVSQQLRTLARDLGVELVVQDGRRLRLTSAARTLLDHTDELFARWEEVRAAVLASDADESGTLRLCGFSTAAAALLPELAVDMGTLRPNARVRIIEADPEECFDLLLTDEADVAVVVPTSGVPSIADPRFEQHHLMEDPLDLLVPQTHPLAHEAGAEMSRLADEPWIMDRPASPYHQLLLSACATAGFTPVAAHYASTWDTGAALVGSGLGIALIPRMAHVPAGHPIVRIPLVGEAAPKRHVLTGIRRGSADQPLISSALQALREIAERRSDSQQDDGRETR